MTLPDKIATLEFESIRGLPKFDLAVDGKSLMLLSGNGGGKSSVVDGIEFLLNGRLERFHGDGTGAKGLKAATKNVFLNAAPKVVAKLKASKGSLERRGESSELTCSGVPAESYRAIHTSTSAFILRRSQLLQFIGAQDAERYQQVVSLLSLDSLNFRQEAFVEAVKIAESRSSEAIKERYRLQNSVPHAASGSGIRSEADAVSSANAVLGQCGIENVSGASDFPAVVDKLKARRPANTSAKREELSEAKQKLSRVEGVDSLVAAHKRLKTSKDELEELRSTVPEADMANVVFAGYDYVVEHPEIEDCPTCEQHLPKGASGLKARLEERRDDLALWDEKAKKVRQELGATREEAKRLLDELKRCENELSSKDGISKDALTTKLTACNQLIHQIDFHDAESTDSVPELPAEYGELAALAVRLLTVATTELAKISAQDAEPIEAAIQHLETLDALLPKLSRAEALEKNTSLLLKKAEAARDAFNAARETALDAMFKKIAATVLRYYETLHDLGSGAGSSKAECTAVALEPLGRARAGGLKLTVDFLGKAIADPRAYLSEGHLDSLGLCIFLACVKHFHAPGGLLVLDDVLTSIDADHRHNVATLILTEFGDNQVLITTHDEYWWKQFESAVHAVGRRKQWTFTRFVNWTLEHGPETSAYEGSREWVAQNLKEPQYQQLGGSLRVLLESFLKRCAEKLELRIRYKMSGAYTAGDFVTAGIQHELIKALKRAREDDTIINPLIIGVFGTGDLINALSHDKDERLTCKLAEVEKFINSLDRLKALCERHKLIRGTS